MTYTVLQTALLKQATDVIGRSTAYIKGREVRSPLEFQVWASPPVIHHIVGPAYVKVGIWAVNDPAIHTNLPYIGSQFGYRISEDMRKSAFEFLNLQGLRPGKFPDTDYFNPWKMAAFTLIGLAYLVTHPKLLRQTR